MSGKEEFFQRNNELPFPSGFKFIENRKNKHFSSNKFYKKRMNIWMKRKRNGSNNLCSKKYMKDCRDLLQLQMEKIL